MSILPERKLGPAGGVKYMLGPTGFMANDTRQQGLVSDAGGNHGDGYSVLIADGAGKLRVLGGEQGSWLLPARSQKLPDLDAIRATGLVVLLRGTGVVQRPIKRQQPRGFSRYTPCRSKARRCGGWGHH